MHCTGQSIDQWPYISGKTQTPPRQDMVYEHRKFNNDTQYTGAVRRGDWKLVVSREHAAGWFGQVGLERFHGHFGWTLMD